MTEKPSKTEVRNQVERAINAPSTIDHMSESDSSFHIYLNESMLIAPVIERLIDSFPNITIAHSVDGIKLIVDK